MMSTGTCELKLYARNNIFRKKNYKYEILNHLYFGPGFVFWRAALGHFRFPAPHHKKASYGPDISRDCQQISLLISADTERKLNVLRTFNLGPVSTGNIQRSFKGINQQLLFPLKIPCFSYDFRKIPRNAEAILVMNTLDRKNVCSKSAIETPEQTVKQQE